MTKLCIGICLVISMSQQVFSFSLFFWKKPKDIWEALENNDLDSFKNLISQQRFAVDVTNAEGKTLLHAACESGDLEICTLLLEKGANSEAQNKNGFTPLHLASGHGHRLLCDFLLTKGANIEAQDNKGRTSLHVACFMGHSAVCDLLLCKGVNIEAQDNNRETPLHEACFRGHVYVCKQLLRRSANKEAQDKYGSTPLHNACSRGHDEVCNLLLYNGANIEAQDEGGATPLLIACLKGHGIVSRLLIEKGANIEAPVKDYWRPLHLACAFGHAEVYKLLLEKGAKIESRGKNGWTTLHLACAEGQDEACKFLLEKGADINALTNSEETPLMLACAKGHTQVVRLLVADSRLLKETRDKELEGTALHWACSSNRQELCEILLRNGFDAQQAANTLTLAHIAVRNDNEDLLVLFMKHQTNLNRGDKNGYTPLHLACELGHIRTLKQLLLKKDLKNIDLNAKNRVEKTPLHVAVEHGREEVVELLLRYGALANEEDKYKKTPLMYAVEKGSLTLCKLLKAKISTEEFNCIKPLIAGLVQGKRELEKLFDLYYGELKLREVELEVPVRSLGAQTSVSYDSVPKLEEDSQAVQQVSNKTHLPAINQRTPHNSSPHSFPPIPAHEEVSADGAIDNDYDSTSLPDQVSGQGSDGAIIL